MQSEDCPSATCQVNKGSPEDLIDCSLNCSLNCALIRIQQGRITDPLPPFFNLGLLLSSVRDLDERLASLLPTLITREVKESLVVDEVEVK